MSTTFDSPGLGVQGTQKKNSSDAIKRTIKSSNATSNKRLKPNFKALKTRLPSPVGKNYNTIVEVLPCKEDSVFLVDLEKPNGDAAFMKPWKELLNNNPYEALDNFHMIGMPARRDPADLDKNLPLPQGPESNFARYGIACWREENESTVEFGDSLAVKFTDYANRSEDFIGTKNKFINHHNDEPLTFKPMNYFLRDRDTLLLLKKIYGGETVTKADIENENDILIKFFGDVQKGVHLLAPLTEDQWHHLSS